MSSLISCLYQAFVGTSTSSSEDLLLTDFSHSEALLESPNRFSILSSSGGSDYSEDEYLMGQMSDHSELSPQAQAHQFGAQSTRIKPLRVTKVGEGKQVSDSSRTSEFRSSPDLRQAAERNFQNNSSLLSHGNYESCPGGKDPSTSKPTTSGGETSTVSTPLPLTSPPADARPRVQEDEDDDDMSIIGEDDMAITKKTFTRLMNRFARSKKLKTLQKTNKSLASEKASLEKKVAQLEKDLKIKEDARKKAVTDFDSLQASHSKVNKDYKTITNSYCDLESQLKDCQSLNKQAGNKIVDFEKDVLFYEKERRSLAEQVMMEMSAKERAERSLGELRESMKVEDTCDVKAVIKGLEDINTAVDNLATNIAESISDPGENTFLLFLHLENQIWLCDAWERQSVRALLDFVKRGKSEDSRRYRNMLIPAIKTLINAGLYYLIFFPFHPSLAVDKSSGLLRDLFSRVGQTNSAQNVMRAESMLYSALTTMQSDTTTKHVANATGRISHLIGVLAKKGRPCDSFQVGERHIYQLQHIFIKALEWQELHRAGVLTSFFETLAPHLDTFDVAYFDSAKMKDESEPQTAERTRVLTTLAFGLRQWKCEDDCQGSSGMGMGRGGEGTVLMKAEVLTTTWLV